MSARREHRLRNLERRVAELEAEQAARGYLRANVEEMREKMKELKITPVQAGKAVPMDAWWTRTPSTQTMGEKTTVVRAVLRNGFEIVEASACVSKENYSEPVGRDICMGKIRDQVWKLLGFLLQTAVNGVK